MEEGEHVVELQNKLSNAKRISGLYPLCNRSQLALGWGFQPAQEEQTAALLARARRALAERGEGLDRVGQVVVELEDAVREQRADDQERLMEELTDLLYELEE